MANGKFIAYHRVSTQKQGLSGLGLEAQKQTVLTYLNGGNWELVQEFLEVETGKGADALDRRPQLKAAIDACKKQKATLIIAKLDRLARNVHFISGLIESGVDFVCADMPQANKVMLQMYSVMAEWERDQISARTKAALQAAKARGVILGAAGATNLKPNIEARQEAADEFANKLKSIITGMRGKGTSQRRICAELNSLGIKTAKGGDWSLIQLQRVIARF
ncbi:MAG: recombinase family protein [Methylococcales bacterium]|nr:recombinase family protein [Methylococcales bacterium]